MSRGYARTTTSDHFRQWFRQTILGNGFVSASRLHPSAAPGETPEGDEFYWTRTVLQTHHAAETPGDSFELSPRSRQLHLVIPTRAGPCCSRRRQRWPQPSPAHTVFKRIGRKLSQRSRARAAARVHNHCAFVELFM